MISDLLECSDDVILFIACLVKETRQEVMISDLLECSDDVILFIASLDLVIKST